MPTAVLLVQSNFFPFRALGYCNFIIESKSKPKVRTAPSGRTEYCHVESRGLCRLISCTVAPSYLSRLRDPLPGLRFDITTQYRRCNINSRSSRWCLFLAYDQ